MNAENRRDALFDEYVAALETLNGFLVCESLDDCAEQFALCDKSEFDRASKPVRQITDPAALELLSAKLRRALPAAF